MGKKSKPAAPDYTKAAEKTAESNQQMNTDQTWANRPTINTPWGSQSWQAGQGIDPATGKPVTTWTQNTTLSPPQQQALDAQMNIENGRSQAANQLLGQATSAFQKPVDYSTLPQGAQSVTPTPQNAQVNAQNMPASSLTSPGNVQADFQGGGPIQTGVGNTQLQSSFQGGSQPTVGNVTPGQLFSMGGTPGSLATSVDMGPIRGGSATAGQGSSNIAIKSQMDRTAGDWRQRGQDAALQFQAPLQQKRQAALESQLANMGLTRGSEAWNNEMRGMQDQNARDNLQAFGAGQSEAAMLFGQDLQSSQFTNNAQAQDFNQSLQNANLATQTSLANAQMAQQAEMANAANKLAQAQFQNQAQQQGWNQSFAETGMKNQNQQIEFGQGMQNAGLANGLNAQQFGQNQQQANFANQAAGQQFGQNLAAGNFANQAQSQQFGQNQAQGNFYNQAQGQAFNQGAANSAFQNSAAQQNFQNQMTAAQFWNQQNQQNFQNQMTAGGYNQQVRNSALAEMQQQRGQPLNELNALLTGQQVGMPQMPSFNTAGKASGVDYSGAANSQYQAALDVFNAKQAGLSGLMGGAASLGGAAMSSGGWGGLFSMSDSRLKKNVKLVGSHEGVNIYEYDYVWGGPRQLGVMAQQVPHAAAVHDSGYLMVDYSKVWK